MKLKKNSFKLSANSLKHLVGIDARLIELVKEAIKVSSIDFGIPSTGGLRTSTEQRAFDVYAYVDGKASWEPEHLTTVSKCILATAEKLDIPIKWGGNFIGFVDMPHFEIDELNIRFP